MSTELEAIEEPGHRLGIIHAKTPHDVIIQASSIAKELAKIIETNKLFVNIQNRRFVRVEGWSTMGAMLGVLPREVSSIRHDDGAYEATVELIRITDGAVIGRASALVGMDESWSKRNEYARKSMATTRATGKAFRLGFSWIIGLAGFEPTPAEELEGEYHESTPSPREEAAIAALGVEPEKKANGKRPLTPERLAEFLRRKAVGYVGSRSASKEQLGLLVGMLEAIFAGDQDKRHTAQLYLFGQEHAKDIPAELVLAGLDWLKPTRDSGGMYLPDPMAEKEAQMVYAAAIKTERQKELI